MSSSQMQARGPLEVTPTFVKDFINSVNHLEMHTEQVLAAIEPVLDLCNTSGKGCAQQKIWATQIVDTLEQLEKEYDEWYTTYEGVFEVDPAAILQNAGWRFEGQTAAGVSVWMENLKTKTGKMREAFRSTIQKYRGLADD